jgi:hypothetical protein
MEHGNFFLTDRTRIGGEFKARDACMNSRYIYIENTGSFPPSSKNCTLQMSFLVFFYYNVSLPFMYLIQHSSISNPSDSFYREAHIS